MYPFPDTLAGNIAAAATLVLLGVALTVFILKGGLRRQRRKDARQEFNTEAQVKGLLASQEAKGRGLHQVRHDLDSEPVDLTDSDLKREVDGILKKRGPIS